ncbi:MAG: PaREP1 family protein [Nitrospirae bacterium]|nr:PaREP1 family protein [Nitrospirota bacterium]
MSRYDALHKKYLQDAERLLRKRDYPQASEKLWGATAEMIKSIAERRRWKHHSHRDLLVAMSRLAEESGGPGMRTLFAYAQMLHANFYEDFMSPPVATQYARDVRRLIVKLQSLNGQP